MNKSENLTEGNILSVLVNFAMPVLMALLLQAMYGAVDLWVVGKFATSADVSGVSTGTQVMQTITFMIVGLSVGITVLVGRRIGEGKPKEAGKIIGAGITLFFLIAIIVTFFMLVNVDNIATALKAPEEAYSNTVDYIKICSLGMSFIVAYNLLGSIFRGIGDSRTPLITVAIACVFNIIGDFILVSKFNMGAAGAAWATILAQCLSVVISLVIMVFSHKKLPFKWKLKYIEFDRRISKEILLLGYPIAVQDILVSLSFLVILAIVNNQGLIASAGIGVAEKICAFIMLVPSAFSQSMSAIVAQNLGAQKPERAQKSLIYSILISEALGIVIAYFTFFHGDVLSSLFANDKEVINAGFQYLKAYAIDCMLTPFLFCFIGFFNGYGKTLFVLIQGLIGAFFIRIPVAYFMSHSENVSLFKIGLSSPCATTIQIILCMIVFIKIIKEINRNKVQL